MGFSLVGNSGDQRTTTTVNETTETADINPQNDLEGAGPGDFGVNLAPNYQGGAGGDTTANISSDFAPVNITETGDVLGDSALAAIQSISANQASDTQQPQQAVASTSTTLSSLLSGNTLYWILGAVLVLFLAHKK